MMIMIVPISAKKIVVVQVTKNGSGWQNLFNLYSTVRTTLQSEANGVLYVNLDCDGSGYSFCRASRNIGSIGLSGEDVLSNSQILQAVNNMIEGSERAYAAKGQLKGSQSQKVAIVQKDKTQMYYVKATWQYNNGSHSGATITITIETDDHSLLDRVH